MSQVIRMFASAGVNFTPAASSSREPENLGREPQSDVFKIQNPDTLSLSLRSATSVAPQLPARNH